MQLRAPWSDTGYNRNAGRDATIIIPCDFGDFSGSELPVLHYSASVSQTRENGIKVNFSAAPTGAVACKKKLHCYFSLWEEKQQKEYCRRISKMLLWSVCFPLLTGFNLAWLLSVDTLWGQTDRSALIFYRPPLCFQKYELRPGVFKGLLMRSTCGHQRFQTDRHHQPTQGHLHLNPPTHTHTLKQIREQHLTSTV